MKKSDLSKLVRETVRAVIRENMGADAPVTDEQLDDATQLLMMVSGRVMAAQNTPVSGAVIDQAVHHIEQADGILAQAGLKADNADIGGMDEAGMGLHPRDWAVMTIQQQSRKLGELARVTDLDDASLNKIGFQLVQFVKKLQGMG